MELELLVLHLYSKGLISLGVKMEVTCPTHGVSRVALTDRVLSAVMSTITPDGMALFINIIRAEFPSLKEVAGGLDKCTTGKLNGYTLGSI